MWGTRRINSGLACEGLQNTCVGVLLSEKIREKLGKREHSPSHMLPTLALKECR